jgi:hypothetical protein
MSGCGGCGGTGLACKTNQKLMVFSALTFAYVVYRNPIAAAIAGTFIACSSAFYLLSEDAQYEVNNIVCKNQFCDISGKYDSILNIGSNTINLPNDNHNKIDFQICSADLSPYHSSDTNINNFGNTYLYISSCNGRDLKYKDIKMKVDAEEEKTYIEISRNEGEKLVLTIYGMHEDIQDNIVLNSPIFLHNSMPLAGALENIGSEN